jgi:hypothetical protein
MMIQLKGKNAVTRVAIWPFKRKLGLHLDFFPFGRFETSNGQI